MGAGQKVLRTLKEAGSFDSLRSGIASFRDLFDLARTDEVQEWESRYAIPDGNRAGY
jgi:hypothetical protein